MKQLRIQSVGILAILTLVATTNESNARPRAGLFVKMASNLKNIGQTRMPELWSADRRASKTRSIDVSENRFAVSLDRQGVRGDTEAVFEAGILVLGPQPISVLRTNGSTVTGLTNRLDPKTISGAGNTSLAGTGRATAYRGVAIKTELDGVVLFAQRDRLNDGWVERTPILYDRRSGFAGRRNGRAIETKFLGKDLSTREIAAFLAPAESQKTVWRTADVNYDHVSMAQMALTSERLLPANR